MDLFAPEYKEIIDRIKRPIFITKGEQGDVVYANEASLEFIKNEDFLKSIACLENWTTSERENKVKIITHVQVGGKQYSYRVAADNAVNEDFVFFITDITEYVDLFQSQKWQIETIEVLNSKLKSNIEALEGYIKYIEASTVEQERQKFISQVENKLYISLEKLQNNYLQAKDCFKTGTINESLAEIFHKNVEITWEALTDVRNIVHLTGKD